MCASLRRPSVFFISGGALPRTITMRKPSLPSQHALSLSPWTILAASLGITLIIAAFRCPSERLPDLMAGMGHVIHLDFPTTAQP